MAEGSSPRVWGKPAYRQVGTHPRSVHPHACGENHRRAGDAACTRGSSPRVWGKQPQLDLNRPQRRFIPTRVGKTDRVVYGAWFGQVHPHACGENPQFRCRRHDAVGSSPRVWGKPIVDGPGTRTVRFIPTRVGKTTCFLRPLTSISVHPHACGENQPHPHRLRPSNGSSPRVWGKL